MKRSDYMRASDAIRGKRWDVVRFEAKRRDGFKCVECGKRGRLEVHHVLPVRTHPQLAFDMSNVKTLCVPCHARHTRIENGWQEFVNPKRAAWRALLDEGKTSCSNP
jgi:5-methylcytosine-specific restriction protein A